MVDFNALLKKPAGEAKKPPALPPGEYPAVIKSHEFGDQNKNRTPYVRFHLALTGWPESVHPDDQAGVDLSKKTLRRDYYITDDALWRLDEFIRSCKVGMSGREYTEVIPELTGTPVVAEVQQYMAQNNDIGNQIGALRGAD